jgi:hypothetical protein
MGTKLRRGVEIPFSAEDAAGAEFETDSEEPEQDAPAEAAGAAGSAQQGKAATPSKQRQQGEGVRGDDSDFEMSSDIGAPSDDEVLDSDAMVSDDQAPSDINSDISDELPLAFKQRSASASKQSSGVSGSRKPGSSGAAATGQRRKLNTPNKQQQRSVRGPLSPGQPNGAVGSTQQVLGKRRVSHDGGSESKRHAGSPADAAAAAADADSFKDAMLRRLLAKKSGGDADAAAAAATPAAASSSAGGQRTPATATAHGSASARQSSLRQQQQQQPRRLEGRLSQAGSLQRTLSDHDVRQKATGHLLTGLQRAVQEARDKHAQQQQQEEEANGQPQQPLAAGVPPLVLPDAQQLAETIEDELFKLCGEDSCCSPICCRLHCAVMRTRRRQLARVAAVHVIVGTHSKVWAMWVYAVPVHLTTLMVHLLCTPQPSS